jgi:outer membrane lipoprotein-sorting protein
MMQTKMTIGVLACASALLVANGMPASAQAPAKAPQVTVPAQPAPAATPGTVGSPWQATASPDQGGLVLEPKQVEVVNKVSAYFNALTNLKGSFVQTNAEKKRQRGKFYVKRPGRFRFEYALPSKQVIISDGHILAIQDLDLGNEDATELDNTPFRLLVRKDVDLMRDARIVDVQEADDLLVVTLRDRSPDAPGQIKLFLAKKPTIELKEWVTTDAQGLETRVEVSELNRTEEIDPKLFVRGMLTWKKIQ